ncbi:MAG: DedA family protein [Hyphomonadaceae bacterium]|nr:DedA family protein [Hyphomonadaceae bacterium]
MDMFWQLAGVFLAAAASASILPGTTEIAMAAVLGLGSATIVPVVAVATAGSVAGSGAQWALGRFLARFKDHKRFPLKQADYDKYAVWFQKYGVWALGMSWLPGVGDVLTLVGGLFRTPFFLSMALVAVAKGLRFALFAYAFVAGLPWLLRLFGTEGAAGG